MDAAIGRAWLSLDGLSVGDAFGERFFTLPELALERISRRELPAAPWTYTDDTEMALSIVEILIERGSIDQDLLAKRFADRMQPDRHYGPGTEALLAGLKTGREWRRLSKSGHGGIGSWSCKNALAEALTCHDVGEVAMHGLFSDVASFPTGGAADADPSRPWQFSNNR